MIGIRILIACDHIGRLECQNAIFGENIAVRVFLVVCRNDNLRFAAALRNTHNGRTRHYFLAILPRGLPDVSAAYLAILIKMLYDRRCSAVIDIVQWAAAQIGVIGNDCLRYETPAIRILIGDFSRSFEVLTISSVTSLVSCFALVIGYFARGIEFIIFSLGVGPIVI